jgi:hypothetical protein
MLTDAAMSNKRGMVNDLSTSNSTGCCLPSKVRAGHQLGGHNCINNSYWDEISVDSSLDIYACSHHRGIGAP